MIQDFLGRMAAGSRERARQARTEGPSVEELRNAAAALPPPPKLRHDRASFDVIAEVKLRSPAEGRLAGDSNELEVVVRQAVDYARGGAVAISVLTEPDAFHGSLDHLRAVAEAVPVPVLRKDFLVDPYQVAEARAHGAAGVLVIARILDDPSLLAMIEQALELDMFVLLEAFDAVDLARAAGALERAGAGVAAGGRGPPVLVGLNCRDLTTLQVEPGRFGALVPDFPRGCSRVAESGLGGPEDAARVAALGYDLALVGTALMRSDDPAATLARFIEAGRGARTVSGARP